MAYTGTTATTSGSSNHHCLQQQQQQQQICGFCKNNKESPEVYLSHRVRDDQGRTTCPALRRYICPNCGSTGDEAHTRSKCPNLLQLRQLRDSQRAHSDRATGHQGHSSSSHHSLYSLNNNNNSKHQPNYNSYRRSPPFGGHQQHQYQQQHQQLMAAAAAAAAPSDQQLDTQTTSSAGSTPPREPEDDLVLGPNRVLANMGRVTNSRYNSAGRLRNRRQHNGGGGGANFSGNHRPTYNGHQNQDNLAQLDHSNGTGIWRRAAQPPPPPSGNQAARYPQHHHF